MSTSSCVGSETGLGAGGLVTEIVGSGCGGLFVSSSNVCELVDGLLELAMTGIGTSAAESVPEGVLSLASDMCPTCWRSQRL